MIRLPCEPRDDLDWMKQIEEAEKREEIVWEFSLGLDAPYFPLEEELRFQALSLALTKFAKEIWPQFEKKTKSAVLYRGSADFSLFFKWSETLEANFEKWKEGRLLANDEHLRRVFCLESFVAYFQMLAHKLPDELSLVLEFEGEGLGTLAERHHLLSLERFRHFIVERTPARVGVCFPPDEACGEEVLGRLDRVLKNLKEPFKAIPEPFLTEGWDGIDMIYVLSDQISPVGKRMLMGFSAAGGRVAVEGKSLGIPNEVSSEAFWEEVRGRGI